MKILKFLLVIAVFVFQIDFAQAGIKKHPSKAKAKPHIARSAAYYNAAKYFKASPRKAVKTAKNSKIKKGLRSKRAVASYSKSKKKHLR